MKRCTLLLLSLCLLSASAQSWDVWTNHLSYRHADYCEAAGGLVFGVFGGNLLSFDVETEEVRLYAKHDGLGSKGIVSIGYTNTLRRLVILYEDNTVDMLDPVTDDITHLVSLRISSNAVGTPLTMSVCGNYAVIGSSKGVALLNLSRWEVRGFYAVKSAVTAATMVGGKLFANVGGKLLAGNITDNLYDVGQWQTVYDGVVTLLQPSAGGLYVQTETEGLMWMDATTLAAQSISTSKYTKGHRYGTRTIFFRNGQALLFNDSDPTSITSTLAYDGTPEDILPLSNNRLFICRGSEGMQAWKITSDGTLTADGTPISGYGAQTDRTGYLQFAANNRLLTSGGSFDYYESIFYAPNAGYLDNGNWTFMENENMESIIGTPYRSLTSMVQDPKDPTHHFVATGDYGLFEFRDTKFIKQYNIDNSPLQAFWNNTRNYVRTDALCYDNSGNLWMSNEQVDTILRVLKSDGTWRGIYIGDIAGCRHVEHILFDSQGRLWATQRDWIGNMRSGILRLEIGDLDKPNSHNAVFRYGGINQDAIEVDFSQGVYSMAQDLQGRIWIGTYSGPYVIEDPDAFSQMPITVAQPCILRNDGTDDSDYLLEGIAITALAVDNNDRKWIGTAGYGLYVVSSDGTEVLGGWTAADSPLPSDNILSLAVHPNGNEIYVGTDAGLVSLSSTVSRTSLQVTATEDSPTYNAADRVTAYPNPVRPQNGQYVTINGLQTDDELEITNAAGFVVAASRSTSGTFHWDCRDEAGNAVPAGIYYVRISQNGKPSHIATRIAVVR